MVVGSSKCRRLRDAPAKIRIEAAGVGVGVGNGAVDGLVRIPVDQLTRPFGAYISLPKRTKPPEVLRYGGAPFRHQRISEVLVHTAEADICRQIERVYRPTFREPSEERIAGLE